MNKEKTLPLAASAPFNMIDDWEDVVINGEGAIHVIRNARCLKD